MLFLTTYFWQNRSSLKQDESQNQIKETVEEEHVVASSKSLCAEVRRDWKTTVSVVGDDTVDSLSHEEPESIEQKIAGKT